MPCPNCQHINPEEASFCNKCGYSLNGQTPPIDKEQSSTKSERKLVSVLFSDLSGYTAMNEKLDPEEVREIMRGILSEINQIISKYDGFVERFAGDAVMVVFGVPQAHEDDPVRAIRSAMEIHSFVKNMSPQLENKVGRPLTMHSGINTGLVVTGEVNLEKGTHGLTGDPINLASRLQSLARAGEILVGESTRNLTGGHFTFQTMEPTKVQGKEDPVKVFKVLSVKDEPSGVRRMQGVQAKLIGRNEEMTVLSDAVESLQQGRGSIISIVGDAGTGKSRLVREFKASLNTDQVQWREGHAYPYTQNTAYYPLTNLLTYAFQIREGDKPDQIREKVEAGVKTLLWDKPEVAKYLGGLFSLSYEDMEEMSPEFWRNQLHQSVQHILEALAVRGPTIILFEDLHWADASFVELLHQLLENTQRPVLFICAYRPSFSLYPDGEPQSLTWPHQIIELKDLPWDQTQAMLQSLLGATHLPDELRYFIQQRVEGNPFYLEEVVNTLIETGVLTADNDGWKLTRPLKQANIPSTIQGVLTARLDRLERDTKRILQEASVIGRAFFYEVLTRVTKLTTPVDGYLSGLESLDLIRARTREPDLEYIFKHALTQEVVYNGLLKTERRDIHQRIGQTMEKLFSDRLPQFYEALAFHYSRGKSTEKAVEYLIKSGEKCLARYSVGEAFDYFKTAFEMLTHTPSRTRAEDLILADVLNNWAFAHYYVGDFRSLIATFESYEDLVRSLDDPSRYGMFCVWLGTAYYMDGIPNLAYEYLSKALSLGEEVGNQRVIGYACCWLAWTFADIGRGEEGVEYGKRAVRISESYPADQYLYFKPTAGIGMCYFMMGKPLNIMEVSRDLLAYGERTANSRSLVMAYFMESLANIAIGDYKAAIEIAKKSLAEARDPFYSYFPQGSLGMAYVLTGQFKEAKETLGKGVQFSTQNRIRLVGTYFDINYGISLIANGQMPEGMKFMEEAREHIFKNQRFSFYVISDLAMGKVYANIAFGPKPSLSILIKNAVFLVKNAPFAGKKAIEYFKKAIADCEAHPSVSSHGQAYMDLGLIYKAKKQTLKAKECFEQAVELFSKCEAHVFLGQAQKELEQLI